MGSRDPIDWGIPVSSGSPALHRRPETWMRQNSRPRQLSRNMKPSRASSLASVSPTTPREPKIGRTKKKHVFLISELPSKAKMVKSNSPMGRDRHGSPPRLHGSKTPKTPPPTPRERLYFQLFFAAASPKSQPRVAVPQCKKSCVPRIIKFPCHVVVSSKMTLPGVKIVRSPAPARVFKKKAKPWALACRAKKCRVPSCLGTRKKRRRTSGVSFVCRVSIGHPSRRGV